MFDGSNDGAISKEDMVNGLLLFHGNHAKAVKESNNIFSKFDFNQNEVLDFTEFVIPNISSHFFLTEKRLNLAFNMIDIDGDGKITDEDLKVLFEGKTAMTHDIIEEMFAEVKCSDHSISYPQFKEFMMANLVSPFLNQSNNK